MARRNAALAVGTLTLSLALVACAGGTSPSGEVLSETSPPLGTEPAGGATTAPGTSGQGSAEAAACAAIQTWSDEMRALADTDPATASVEDVRAQVDTIRTAWEDVKTSLNAVEAADEQAVVDAGQGLETAVDDVSTDIPITDMVNEVKSAA